MDYRWKNTYILVRTYYDLITNGVKGMVLRNLPCIVQVRFLVTVTIGPEPSVTYIAMPRHDTTVITFTSDP